MLEFITWNADPILFNFGPLHIRWYGLMFAIGFWLGTLIVGKMFRHEGAPESWLSILLLWVVGATIIGARLGHVFFYQWDYYSQHPEKIIAFWEGGLASHGGTIAIIIAVLLFSFFTTKRSPLWTFDRLVIPIALVGAMIRIGNLMNSEIYGYPTSLPWGFVFVRGHEWPGLPCHPTQIYEALAYLALFGVLMWMYWKKNAEERPGLIFGVFDGRQFGCHALAEGYEAVGVIDMMHGLKGIYLRQPVVDAVEQAGVGVEVGVVRGEAVGDIGEFDLCRTQPFAYVVGIWKHIAEPPESVSGSVEERERSRFGTVESLQRGGKVFFYHRHIGEHIALLLEFLLLAGTEIHLFEPLELEGEIFGVGAVALDHVAGSGVFAQGGAVCVVSLDISFEQGRGAGERVDDGELIIGTAEQEVLML